MKQISSMFINVYGFSTYKLTKSNNLRHQPIFEVQRGKVEKTTNRYLSKYHTAASVGFQSLPTTKNNSYCKLGCYLRLPPQTHTPFERRNRHRLLTKGCLQAFDGFRLPRMERLHGSGWKVSHVPLSCLDYCSIEKVRAKWWYSRFHETHLYSPTNKALLLGTELLL